MQATTPVQVAGVLLDGDTSMSPVGTCVMWSSNWPDALEGLPAGCVTDPAILAAAVAAVQARREASGDLIGTRVLCDLDGAAAVLHAPQTVTVSSSSLLLAVGARMAEVLAIQQLHATVARLAQTEKLQRALFAIADMAGSDLDMPDMLRGLHRIVGELMYAENFFIALYDPVPDSIRFMYFVDSVDDMELSGVEFPLDEIKHGPTWWTIRDRIPLMGSNEELQSQVSGPMDIHGADSLDWLSVPMLRDGHVKGVVVVQSYLADIGFTNADKALLEFVAEHILTALERKQGREELELRVEERTGQLAEINAALRHEVIERKRGERLQSALYQIAALAGTDESSDRFFGHVHAVVSELLNADNFYLALLSEDGTMLEFAYWIDQYTPQPITRPLGRGLTEYALRSGRAQLVDGQEAARVLVEAGEIGADYLNSPTHSWLGVPLVGSDSAIGVVAVQSYTPQVRYDQPDAELLTFVSYQLASSIQRRRAAEALRVSNVRLEERVEERTRELRVQITVREEVEAQLKHQVMHDSLTGLPNRLYLRDRVDRAIAGGRRDAQRRYALLYLDVDRFKIVNDNLGHLVGDQMLQKIAQRLAECVREPDVVARLSGDEFALLLENVPIPQTACKIAQRVLESIQQPLMIDGNVLHPSASIGIAIGDQRYRAADDLLRDADIALYRAKSAGRHRYVLFDESQQRTAMNVLGLEHELRIALESNQFEPYFQPLVRLADGHVVGYESLVRWQHPTRGVLAPGDFLQVAEDSGQIEAIDWQMYRMVCTAGGALVRDGGYLTINVSPRHFQSEDFDARLLAVVAEAGFNPARLRIEVTEGTLLGDPTAVAKALQRLRNAQIEAALDDFGTGYSSLGYVHKFPLKMIKIDRSFVIPLGQEEAPRTLAVIGAILALTASLGLEVLAEGIETEQQRQILFDMGCKHGQGYLFGRPQPAAYWLKQGSTA